MYVLLALAVVLAGALLYAADRLVKARRRGRLRQQANARLAAAAAQAEVKEQERRARLEASAALTSVLPSIRPHGPRRVSHALRGGVESRAPEHDGCVRVVVLADTHAPRRWRSCPPGVAGYLRAADVILHAGDVCTASVLEELSGYAPVRAVLGNNDGPDVAEWGAAETAEFNLAGLRVAMIHDSGPSTGRLTRMRRRFPGADLVVFGHSHIPLDQSGDGLRIFNPGSPTDRRRQPHGTIGVLRIAGGRLAGARIIPVT